jgi:hypothetical protein
MAAHQNNLCVRDAPAHLICRFDAAHHWHDDIHHHDVRLDLEDLIDGQLAVCRLVNLPMWLLRKQGMQSAPHEMVIIDYEDCCS